MKKLLVMVGVLLLASATRASLPNRVGTGSGWSGNVSGGSPSNRSAQFGAPDLLLAQDGEREGQDPDVQGADTLPGSDEPGERVGQDPDVPGGDVPTTPKIEGPGGRVGNDPDVPDSGGPVR